jgi:transposase InsO family protein
MSLANRLWGAPRIHGELLKLGIDVGQTSVAKYLARHRRPPSQVEDLPVQPHRRDCGNGSLCRSDAFLSAALWFADSLARPAPLWLGVTAHPTAEWMARQLTEACGWEANPTYIVRDRDRVYGDIFTRRLRAMGIRDRPIAPRSPWQNGHAERLIGSLRRECLDHVVVYGERHLRQLLLAYMAYYNFARTHLSLNKDAPVPRVIKADGRIYANPILGGLHHEYARI